jgi:type IV pilus assembly protein PilW
MIRAPLRRHKAGFTLIEMMVALVVGMVVILSVVAVQKAFESHRRTSTAGNDLDNAGAYVLSQLDDMLRPAGAGFTQAFTQTYGCQLYAGQGGSALLPPPAGVFPAPFDGVLNALGGPVRMAPVLILKGNTAAAWLNGGNGSSDVLMVMSGAGQAANLQTTFTAPPTTNNLSMVTTAAFQPNDMILMMDATTPNGPASCLIEQVSAGFAPGAGVTALPLAGTYYSGAGLTPANFTVDGAAVSLGNPVNSNYPVLQLIGVGAGNQLCSYDMLNFQAGAPTPNCPSPMADSVMELHARYLTTTAGGSVYVDPGTPPYDPVSLTNGSLAASTSLNNIKAIRVGLIMKSPLLEQMQNINGTWTHVGPSTLTLFADLGPLSYTRTLDPTAVCTPTSNVLTNPNGNIPLPACELDFRYRTVELTIPLRNPMLY